MSEPGNSGHSTNVVGFLLALGGLMFVAFGCCAFAGVLVFDQDRTVDLEHAGWHFEARYTVGLGVVTEYSELSFRDDEVGRGLPHPVYLVTPIGDFCSDNSNGSTVWDAISSNPQIWSRQYSVPAGDDGEPWVRQLEHDLDKKRLAAQGWYVAPPNSREAPWNDCQLAGTPSHWIYVYRLTWRDGEQSYLTTGYWVDPTRLSELEWASEENAAD